MLPAHWRGHAGLGACSIDKQIIMADVSIRLGGRWASDLKQLRPEDHAHRTRHRYSIAGLNEKHAGAWIASMDPRSKRQQHWKRHEKECGPHFPTDERSVSIVLLFG